jgi:hypothetical protein
VRAILLLSTTPPFARLLVLSSVFSMSVSSISSCTKETSNVTSAIKRSIFGTMSLVRNKQQD